MKTQKLQKKKVILIMLIYMFTLLANTLVFAVEPASSPGQIKAMAKAVPLAEGVAEEAGGEQVEDKQYFEMRAKKVNEIDGTKQLVMELYGNDIEFKRICSAFLI